MSCLDVGFGSGDVTLKMAALVGAKGNVVGVDRDQTILRFARQEAERQELPVTFRQLDTEELAEESVYDLVFARYLELYQAVASSREGGDAAIGVRLLGMALEAGLVVPTFRDGEGKRVACVTMEHIREAVVGAGLVSGGDVDNLVAELGRLAEDDRTLMSIAPTFQVWGRRAGA